MAGYDEELNDDDYLNEFEPLTTESGDLLDDSNPYGYDDEEDDDDYNYDSNDEED